MLHRAKFLKERKESGEQSVFYDCFQLKHMKSFEIFELPSVQAPNFVINPVELYQFISFEVKRIYYITKATNGTGLHCHYNEKEFFIMLQGACTAVIDRGKGLEDVLLRGPSSAIYVANYVWHGFKAFSPEAILLALSSANYNPDRSDYLEDYSKYLEIRDIHLAEEKSQREEGKGLQNI